MLTHRLLLLLALCALIGAHPEMVALTDGPKIDWMTIDWAPVKPDGSGGTVPQTQDESGEDWWYDHKNIYNSLGEHIGYVAAGYANWVNTSYDEPDGCYSCDYLTKGADCSAFQIEPDPGNGEPGRVFGCQRATIARYDLAGKMVWCKAFNQAEFYGVIQSQDANHILAIGKTFSTQDRNTSAWLKYNPTSVSQFDTFQGCENLGEPKEHLTIVKVDMDGNQVWNHLYGIVKPQNESLAAAYQRRSEGRDLVEHGSGFRCVGSVQVSAGASSEPWMLDIDHDGYLLWDGAFRNGFVDGGMGLSIARSSVNGRFAVTGWEFHEPSTWRAFVQMYNGDINDHAPFWTEFPRNSMGTIESSVTYCTDINFDAQDNILWPVMYNLTRPPGNLDVLGKGRIYTLKNALGGTAGGGSQVRSFVEIGDIGAFDLKMGIAPSSDGGFAVVTSKIVENISGLSDPELDNVTIDFCTDANDYTFDTWNSDAIVVKFEDNSGQWLESWRSIFDSFGDRDDFPGDIKKQECLYAITEAATGGFVVSGNCSPNFDDYYLVKLHDGCEWFMDDWDSKRPGHADPYSLTVDQSTAPGGTLTWSTNMKIKGTTLVKSGYRLLVDGATIQLADSRRVNQNTTIIVEPGGILELTDNAVLSSVNFCEGTMWDGVQLRGNPFQPYASQGKVIMNNATIEHARMGIRVDKAIYRNYSPEGQNNGGGGIVTAYNSSFRNCRIGVYFTTYAASRTSPWANPSEFENCSFICDAPLNSPWYSHSSGLRLGSAAQVIIWDYHGIRFKNNVFQDLATLPSNLRGMGINFASAAFKLDCDAPDPNGYCSAGQENEFNDFRYGINGSSFYGATAPYINECKFTNCVTGIYLKESITPYIARNEFTIGADLVGTGLYMYNCDAYLVEGNIFDGDVTYALGAQVYNSNRRFDFNSNEIYRNDFDNLYYASLGDRYNRGFSVVDGLDFKCNRYLTNTYDVVTFAAPGISSFQGNWSQPAANLFGGCGITNGALANWGDPYSYYHHTTTVAVPQPGCFTNAVTLVNNGQPYSSEDCPDNLSLLEFRLVPAGNEFLEAAGEYETSYDNYTSTIDGGSTTTLVDLVENDQPDSDVYTAFIGASPYLSDEALLSVINDKPTPLAEGLLVNIIVANSPVSAAVMLALQERTPPLSASALETIADAQTGISARTLLESDLAAASENRRRAYNNYRYAIQFDTKVTDHLTVLANLLAGESDDEALAELLSVRILQRDFEEAQTVLNTLRARSGWFNFCVVQQMVLDWHAQDLTEFELANDPDKLAQIESIAAAPEDRGFMAANILLELVFGREIPMVDEHIPGLPGSLVTALAEEEPAAPEAARIRCYPNPFTQHSTIEVDVPAAAELIVSDPLGKVVYRADLQPGPSSVKLSAAQLGSGVYFCNVFSNGVLLQTVKLVHLP